MKSVIDYKTRVASRYTALTKDQIALRLIESDSYFASEKLDGHFVSLAISNGKASLFNRTGKELFIEKIIKEAEQLFPDRNIIFAAELYVHMPGQRTRSFHVSEAITAPDRFDLRLAVYDIIEIDGSAPSWAPPQLMEELATMIPSGHSIHTIAQHVFHSKLEVAKFYEEVVEKQHGEGLVVRSLEGMTYKIKPLHTFDAVVIGYSEGDDDRKGMIRNVLTAFMKSDGTFTVSAKVGGGFTEEQRTALFHQLKGMHTHSEYIEVSDSQVAFQMVRPEIIIEFSCLDLISEVNGKTVRKMDLSYNATAGYSPIAPAQSVTMISPVFQHIRSDKGVNTTDLRFQQVTDLIDITADTSIALPASLLLKREVYIKEMKGEKAVRKFLAWKTNKEQSGEFPPYVFSFTDFSAGRKDMLQQEIKTARTEEEVMKAFADSLAENVKKGWTQA